MSLNIERINELAKKSRETGLTEEEKAEQAVLRRNYIDSVVGNLRGQLENTYIKQEDGTIQKLTPQKFDKSADKSVDERNDEKNGKQ